MNKFLEFSLADKNTLKYRKEHRELGVGVVFRNGMSREETLNFLANPLVQEMLQDPDEYLRKKYYEGNEK